jgi:hypothetical protein
MRLLANDDRVEKRRAVTRKTGLRGSLECCQGLLEAAQMGSLLLLPCLATGVEDAEIERQRSD